jgi:CspA family cold shock protein
MVTIGTIKRLRKDLGYGFIALADGGGDVFLHRSALKNAPFSELVEGQQVELVVVPAEKGPRAEDVYLIQN